jgi:hypothetical protein
MTEILRTIKRESGKAKKEGGEMRGIENIKQCRSLRCLSKLGQTSTKQS